MRPSCSCNCVLRYMTCNLLFPTGSTSLYCDVLSYDIVETRRQLPLFWISVMSSSLTRKFSFEYGKSRFLWNNGNEENTWKHCPDNDNQIYGRGDLLWQLWVMCLVFSNSFRGILYAVQIASVVPATSCSDIFYVLASEFHWLLSLWLTSVVCCSRGNLAILK